MTDMRQPSDRLSPHTHASCYYARDIAAFLPRRTDALVSRLRRQLMDCELLYLIKFPTSHTVAFKILLYMDYLWCFRFLFLQTQEMWHLFNCYLKLKLPNNVSFVPIVLISVQKVNFSLISILFRSVNIQVFRIIISPIPLIRIKMSYNDNLLVFT